MTSNYRLSVFYSVFTSFLCEFQGIFLTEDFCMVAFTFWVLTLSYAVYSIKTEGTSNTGGCRLRAPMKPFKKHSLSTEQKTFLAQIYLCKHSKSAVWPHAKRRIVYAVPFFLQNTHYLQFLVASQPITAKPPYQLICSSSIEGKRCWLKVWTSERPI